MAFFDKPFYGALYKEVYYCSNGEDYEVLTYRYRMGRINYSILGFCPRGTLKKHPSEYSLWFTNGKSHSDPEVRNCARDESPEVVRCMKEYEKLNANRTPRAQPINHGRGVPRAMEPRSSHSEEKPWSEGLR